MAVSHLILVTGPAQSGKSHYAVERACKFGSQIVFVATYLPTGDDEEMKIKIERHRRKRPPHWNTIEGRLDLSELMKGLSQETEGVLIDDISLWISHLMGEGKKEAEILSQVKRFVDGLKNSSLPLAVVTSEVGWDLVPPHPQGRLFRELVGRMNQLLAGIASEVILTVAGQPLCLKKGGQTP